MSPSQIKKAKTRDDLKIKNGLPPSENVPLRFLGWETSHDSKKRDHRANYYTFYFTPINVYSIINKIVTREITRESRRVTKKMREKIGWTCHGPINSAKMKNILRLALIAATLQTIVAGDCPLECNCNGDQVVCSNQGLKKLPDGIPLSTRKL